MRTVEAKRIVEEEAAEIERTHDSLLEGQLEGEREWLEELERRGALLEQREEEQNSDFPLAMAAEQQPELSIPSPFGRKSSEEESPPHTSRETKFSGANGDRELSIFPIQLTTSRIGNLTQLIFLSRYGMSIHTYILWQT